MHRFDTDHECDGRTDRRPDDGKDARSILLSRVKMVSICDKLGQVLFMLGMLAQNTIFCTFLSSGDVGLQHYAFKIGTLVALVS